MSEVGGAVGGDFEAAGGLMVRPDSAADDEHLAVVAASAVRWEDRPDMEGCVDFHQSRQRVALGVVIHAGAAACGRAAKRIAVRFYTEPTTCEFELQEANSRWSASPSGVSSRSSRCLPDAVTEVPAAAGALKVSAWFCAAPIALVIAAQFGEQ